MLIRVPISTNLQFSYLCILRGFLVMAFFAGFEPLYRWVLLIVQSVPVLSHRFVQTTCHVNSLYILYSIQLTQNVLAGRDVYMFSSMKSSMWNVLMAIACRPLCILQMTYSVRCVLKEWSCNMTQDITPEKLKNTGERGVQRGLRGGELEQTISQHQRARKTLE